MLGQALYITVVIFGLLGVALCNPAIRRAARIRHNESRDRLGWLAVILGSLVLSAGERWAERSDVTIGLPTLTLGVVGMTAHGLINWPAVRTRVRNRRRGGDQ